MPRSGCQLGVRDPQPLLLLPLLARAHRHNAILRTISVDTSDVLADESRLAPRAVKSGIELTIGSDPLLGRFCSYHRGAGGSNVAENLFLMGCKPFHRLYQVRDEVGPALQNHIHL